MVRSQTKKINYEQVYMKNLVPKIQKLDMKNNNHGNQPTNNTSLLNAPQPPNSRESGQNAASIRHSINPVIESPSAYNSKINYKIFAEKPERNSNSISSKISNGLQNMKITLRSESASS